jgi:hypothetical protein
MQWWVNHLHHRSDLEQRTLLEWVASETTRNATPRRLLRAPKSGAKKTLHLPHVDPSVKSCKDWWMPINVYVEPRVKSALLELSNKFPGVKPSQAQLVWRGLECFSKQALFLQGEQQ